MPSLEELALQRAQPNQIQPIIDAINTRQSAEVRRSSDQRPRLTYRLSIPLDVASTATNPLVISNPFNGVYLEQSSGVNNQLFICPGGNVDEYTTRNPVLLQLNSSFYSPEEIKGCVLLWAAQPNQIVTLVFFLGIDFRPGGSIVQLQ